jgi:hypothetical protein
MCSRSQEVHQLGCWAEKGSPCYFEAVQSVDLVVGVHCQENVVRVRNKSLKSCVVVLVGGPRFGVNGGVFIAQVIVGSSCKEGFPI